jgi:hypothetical protein
MNLVQEAFAWKRMTATGTVKSGNCNLGGFLCEVSGTITLYDGIDANGALITSALPVTAGTFHPIPAMCVTGLHAVLAGGAVGTFFVD